MMEKLLAEITVFVKSELASAERHFIEGRHSETWSAVQEVRGEVRRGWWLPQMPQEEGGMGLDLLDFSQVAEVLGRNPVAHLAFNCQAPDAGNMELLALHGTSDQKEKFLEPLLAGELNEVVKGIGRQAVGSLESGRI